MRHAKIGLLLFLTACLPGPPAVRVTRLSPTPLLPRVAGFPILIFQAHQPRCAFDELATFRATRTTSFGVPVNHVQTTDDLLESIRVKAREVGGDAVIGLAGETLATDTSPMVTVGVDIQSAWVLTGTIIRFKRPECAE
jgi:hypothetical protein